MLAVLSLLEDPSHRLFPALAGGQQTALASRTFHRRAASFFPQTKKKVAATGHGGERGAQYGACNIFSWQPCISVAAVLAFVGAINIAGGDARQWHAS
mmetsp:Transcript_19443/g.54343  ORF Transcript_19443/g.54343 Transcript_19443/m.54343 type:complete len:98 (+) Transcript_19443:2364-2657(+)